MSAELLADLARVKVLFQLRAISAAMGFRDDAARRLGLEGSDGNSARSNPETNRRT